MRPPRENHTLIKLVGLALLLVGLVVLVYTVWAWRVRADATEIKLPTETGNAYCADGFCYRTDGQLIGPDPLNPQAGQGQPKVPEFVPPKK